VRATGPCHNCAHTNISLESKLEVMRYKLFELACSRPDLMAFIQYMTNTTNMTNMTNTTSPAGINVAKPDQSSGFANSLSGSSGSSGLSGSSGSSGLLGLSGSSGLLGLSGSSGSSGSMPTMQDPMGWFGQIDLVKLCMDIYVLFGSGKVADIYRPLVIAKNPERDVVLAQMVFATLKLRCKLFDQFVPNQTGNCFVENFMYCKRHTPHTGVLDAKDLSALCQQCSAARPEDRLALVEQIKQRVYEHEKTTAQRDLVLRHQFNDWLASYVDRQNS
jgi:hypothetical protein